MRNFKRPTRSRTGAPVTLPQGQKPPLTVVNWTPQGVALGSISYDNGQPTTFGTGQPTLVPARRP